MNVNSNNPPNIIKNLSESLSRHINNLSCDKTVFNNSKELFNNTLCNSGFDHRIKFQRPTENEDRSRNKNRGATNIGKNFCLLLDKHFPKANMLSKVFNRNNLKVSYSSMPNFASKVSSHNTKRSNEIIAKHPHHATPELKRLVN